ncbi:M23 family metallopeptidase [Mesobacillus maritimus]|uniref:M23 family metallopeptidase n=1 Tax=Mesobacillus maritimus TaxID=1643336 RepID=UPI00203D0505|nr:M23 family metallopeptidase [Mesobacillus maritimus]MCM3586900.1 M23 family metallopeptidase [Mesobacillus maritimus]MCM3668745.1 M23 family metallopeptidase [Mesobacillus maritimus]
MREEKSSQEKSFKRFFKKRWMYPAVYLASAAIILTGVLYFQNSGEQGVDEIDQATDSQKQFSDEPAIEVNSALENFTMPVKDVDNAVVKMQFYDNESDKADQEAALVVYNNQYHPNTGIDIASKDGKEFDVLASLSGEVTMVKEDALLGNVIEIEHDNGIVTQYQSIKNMQVKAGDMVKQGDAIATAGTSQFNEKAGIHVHFEIRKDGTPVNPLDYLDKPLSELKEAEMDSEGDAGKSEAGEGANMEEDTSTESSTTEEGTTTEEGSPTNEDASTEEGTDTEEDAPAEEGTDAEEETPAEGGTDSEEDANAEQSSNS